MSVVFRIAVEILFVQIIELILKEYGTQLSEQQYEKINNYLERANQQTSQQQILVH